MTKSKTKPQDQQDYDARLAAMTEEQLEDECASKIWLSAYARNNPRSAYHWQCDACFSECSRRGRADIYSDVHARLAKAAG